MKRFYWALLSLLMSGPAWAQPALWPVNHPQKSAYFDPSEFPLVSGQCHLMNPDGTMGHLHVEVHAPIYADVTASTPVRYAFDLVAFQVDGYIYAPWSMAGPFFRDLVWDATGTSTPPPMIGNPTGVATWSGRITMDPSMVDHSSAPILIPPHGWFSVPHTGRILYNDGRTIETNLSIPFYSVQDPSAPETIPDGLGPARVLVLCQDYTGATGLGDPAVEVREPLPILGPITAPWTLHSDAYTYAGDSVDDPPARFELRKDLNLHIGIQGDILASQDVPTIGGQSALSLNTNVIDPVVQSGVHKEALIWEQNGGPPSDPLGAMHAMWALLVFTVDGEAGATPPPPPPPPLPTQTWQNVVPEFQQLLDSASGFLGQFKICANGICQVIH